MTVGEKSAKRQDAIQQIMFCEIYFWRAETFVMQSQQTQLGAVQKVSGYIWDQKFKEE